MTKKTTLEPAPEQKAPPEPMLKELIAEENAAHLKRLDVVFKKWTKDHSNVRQWSEFSTLDIHSLNNVIEIAATRGMAIPAPAAAGKPKTLGPFTTGNKTVASAVSREQPQPMDPDLFAERLLKATTPKKK